MKQGDIWYVTFGPHKSDESGESKVRSTRTFKSEVDAKLFAMQILSKGWTASAGTLNPHQPKQVVGPSQIESWADPGWAAKGRPTKIRLRHARPCAGYPRLCCNGNKDVDGRDVARP